MKKKVIIIISVLVLIILITGITYAFFGTSYSTENLKTKSGKIDINYTNDGEVSGTLLPMDNYLNGLSTASTINLNESSIETVATIKLDIEEISEYLQNDSLNWTLLINGEVKKEGDFLDTLSGETITLYDSYKLTTDTTEIKLYVWLDGEKASNETMNQTFVANLYVETHQITAVE